MREPLQNEGTAHAFLGVKRWNLRETHAKHGGGSYCKGLEKLLKGSWTLRIWLRVRMSRYDNPERGSIGDNIGDCYTWTSKVCKIMAFMAVIMGLGLLFYILLGV